MSYHQSSSTDCSANTNMSANMSETADAAANRNENETDPMLVPRREVTKFLETLKRYSDSCSSAKGDVIAAKRTASDAAMRCEAVSTTCRNAEAEIRKLLMDVKVELGEYVGELKNDIRRAVASAVAQCKGEAIKEQNENGRKHEEKLVRNLKEEVSNEWRKITEACTKIENERKEIE